MTVSLTHPHDPYAMRRSYWDRYDHDAIDLPRVGPLPVDDGLEDIDDRHRRAVGLGELEERARKLEAQELSLVRRAAEVESLQARVTETLAVVEREQRG